MLNYIIKMITQRQFSPSIKRRSEGRVRPADPRVPAGSGSGSGYADPHEGRVGLGLRKIYLSTLVTRPSIRPDSQFEQVYLSQKRKKKIKIRGKEGLTIKTERV